jgi:peptidoglycan/LPS O-acetylase OafA/YrhL
VVVAVVRRPYPVLAGLALAGIVTSAVLRAVAYTDDGGLTAFHVYVQSIYRMDAPLVGALAGVAWVAGWLDRVPPKAAAWATALSLAALAMATFKTTPLSPILFQGLYTAVAAAAAVLVVSVLLSGPSPGRRLFRLRPLVLVGTISYSLYLWHLPVMMFVERNATDWPLGQRMLVALIATGVIGALSYHFVERPFLRRKAKARA